MRPSKQTSCLVVLLLILATGPARVRSQALPWDGPPFSADPTATLTASARIPRDPNAAATVFLEERQLVLDGEERAKKTIRRVYRVESQAGVEGWAIAGSERSPWRQKRPEIRARVIAPDGAVYPLDPSVLSDAPAHDERPEVYDDVRSFSGPLPGVSVGSIVEEEIVLEDTAPLFAGALNSRVYFGHDQPVLRSVLAIDAPASLRLRYFTRLLPGLEVKKTESNGTSFLRFEQGPLKAIENKEKSLPDDVPLWPAVDFSAAASWNAVATAYSHAVESAIGPAGLSPLLEGSQGLAGDALLRKLVTSLHQHVRYTGVEFGISSLIPHAARETVGKKYGDCKDKAVVLVSLLKAVGVPAELALLSTRGSDDVDPDLPGLGQFDHAIVHIPSAPGRWIDATAEYLDPGSLPWADQGRLALLIDPATTSLVRIPVAASGDNLLVEKREFTLAEYGPARIVETSEPHGDIAGGFRAEYGQTDAKDTRGELEKYVKQAYLAEALSGVTHTPSTDLTQDFSLRLEVARGNRGYSSVDDAVVVIHPAGIVNQLPVQVAQQEDEDAPGANQTGKKARTHDIFFEPFATEWRYHIVPPPGFAAQPLPQDRTVALGPASLTQHYKTDTDGSVSVTWRFDTTKPRYSPDELRDLRKALATLQNSDVTVIRFVQTGATLLAAGRVKEALAAYASLATLHPGEALHHMQIASTMLTVGLGEQARAEAQKAIALDTNSSLAYQTQAWILEHDLIGRRFGKGFDLAGAVASYRKAEQLDPKDYTTKANLAILLEYDAQGMRYSTQAHLDEAVLEYRALAETDPQRAKEYDDNLLYALAYRERWKEAAEKAASLPGNATRQSILTAAAAAQLGAAAAVAEAGRRTGNETDRSNALVNAANLLLKLRLYRQSVDLLNAAATSQENSTATRARIQALSAVRPHEEALLPATDVRRIVQDYLACLMGPAFAPEKMFGLLEFDAEDRKEEEEAFSRQSRLMHLGWRAQGLPDAVILDTVLSNLKFSSEGDDTTGYRIRAQSINAQPITFLISRQPGGYRIVAVAGEKGMAGAGVEVLRRLLAGDLKNAKLWLDWVRESLPLQSGEDPLAGPVFPRFWTRGDDPDPARMKLAALALLVNSSQVRAHLDTLKAARAAATGQDQSNLDLAIAIAESKLKDWPSLREAAGRLLAHFPGSDAAFRLFTTACLQTKDWPAWQKAISDRLARLPDDIVALRSSARLAVSRGDFAESRAILRKLIDGGRQDANDLNGYTWEALFTGKVTDEDISLAQQASALLGGNSYAVLHTLACLYAETGKSKEARELLLQAMRASGLDEPDAPIWFGLGRIAENYGVDAAALADYERMEERPGDEQPDSTRQLALARVRKLKSGGGS